jgi:DNA-binding response OmpR family regulator
MNFSPGPLIIPNKSEVEILIVEDSPTQALALGQMIEGAGYKVAVAENGLSALEYLNTNIPTLIISDIVMPKMDGYELCKQIKKNETWSKIPVILVTFLTDPADVFHGLECGADNFITKPYEEVELISRINYLLINQELRRQSGGGIGVEVFFGGRRHLLTAERWQIIDLLLSSFEAAVNARSELERANRELTAANKRLIQEIAERKSAEEQKEVLLEELKKVFADMKELRTLLPICSSCKKVRNDQGYWQQIESYIGEHSDAEISHSLCPDCAAKLYPEYFKE